MSRRDPVVRRASVEKPSLSGMEGAVRDFLTAAGLDPARHPELRQTPALVAKAWANEFLDGYRTEPKQVLAERMPSAPRGGELVIVSDVAFQSVCPHHLLPYGGKAHIAYLPERSVVGFGQLVQLLDCLGHRLVLQEDLARQIADALVAELGAKGAAVVLEAEQACLALRGGRRSGSKVLAEAYAGAMKKERELRERFLKSVRRG